VLRLLANVDNVVFTLPGSIDDSQVTVVSCQSSNTTQAFSADPNEVDVAAATLGTCQGQETAFVLYFVTINDAP